MNRMASTSPFRRHGTPAKPFLCYRFNCYICVAQKQIIRYETASVSKYSAARFGRPRTRFRPQHRPKPQNRKPIYRPRKCRYGCRRNKRRPLSRRLRTHQTVRPAEQYQSGGRGPRRPSRKGYRRLFPQRQRNIPYPRHRPLKPGRPPRRQQGVRQDIHVPPRNPDRRIPLLRQSKPRRGSGLPRNNKTAFRTQGRRPRSR